MAHIEPMDVDNLPSDFDDKENSLQNSNVLSKTPSTEKGYEELDVSELNMKLRYSTTPTNSSMSRSYTANYKGDSGPNSWNNTVVIDNNLTQSLNSTITKTDVLKSPKLPLQALPTSLFTNSDLEANISVTVTGTDNDDNLSIPSTASSALQTPEATTPTKADGSPIMRGLRSVLNMFRSSNSPVPPEHASNTDYEQEVNEEEFAKHHQNYSATCHDSSPMKDSPLHPLLVSTPISNTKFKDSNNSSVRNSPLKDSVVFIQDLERELQWQDETDIFFKHEKNPVNKLCFQSGPLNADMNTNLPAQNKDMLNSTVEHMDISNADISCKSLIENKISTDSKVVNELGVESDNEFVDCETSYTNKSYILETAQENKPLKVVVQIDNIAQEACLEECIESFNNPYDVSYKVTSKTIIDSEEISHAASNANETINFTSQILVDNSKVVETVATNDASATLGDINTFIVTETVNMSCGFNIEDLISHENDINSPCVSDSVSHTSKSSTQTGSDNVSEAIHETNFIKTNIISLESDVALKSSTDKVPNVMDHPISTSQTYIQKNVEDETLQIIAHTNVHESCFETSYLKDQNNFETEITQKNLTVDPSNSKAEDAAISLDTDDNNTTRILFDINTILNRVKPNHTHVQISNCTLNNEDCIQALDAYSNTSENPLNDTVFITTARELHENIAEPFEISKQCKVTQELNDTKLGFADGVIDLDDNNLLGTQENHSNVAIETLGSHNINSNTTFEFNMDINNLPYKSDTKNKTIEIKCDSNDVKYIKEVTDDSINNYLHNNDVSQDVKLDSLVYNFDLISVQSQSKIETDSHNNISKYDDNLSEHTQSLQNLPTDLPLPLDVPLPSDDDTEKDCLLPLCSIKNNNVILGFVSDNTDREISSLDPSEILDTANVYKPLQALNEQTLLLENNKNFNNMSDIKVISSEATMSAAFYSIQETPCSQLTSNPTACLQEMNVDSDIKESLPIAAQLADLSLNCTITSSEIVNHQTNVDVRTEITLPDVVQAVNGTEIDTQTNTEILIETIQDKGTAKVDDEDILTSASNSPCVSVTELDLSNKPVQDNDNPTESESNGSTPNSPKYNKKGYTINFDEIENPFATKTNIRMSPPPGETLTLRNNIQINKEEQKRRPNRRMSQPEEKKTDMNKKHFNTSIDRVKIVNSKYKESVKEAVKITDVEENINSPYKNMNDINKFDSENSFQKEIVLTNNTLGNKSKIASPDVKSKELMNNNQTLPLKMQIFDYKSASTGQNGSNDIPVTRNVFNIPEIDDMNFNPFASKSRVCITPPPTGHKDLSINNKVEVTTDSKIEPQKVNIIVCNEEYIQKDKIVSPNLSNIKSSSINTEADVTVREYNTEDEDTVEGPFFEAEELVDTVKVPEIEIEKNALQFDLPTTTNENMDQGELFIDADAFEFLLNQNKSNVIVDSGKESLFLKFDPLFAKRVSSDGVLTALTAMQKKQSTPKKLTRPLINIVQEETPIVSVPGTSNVLPMPEENNEVIVSKPMMVVSPAVATKQPVATPRISLTPKINRQSLNFMSPAMVVIDRLLSLSGNSNLLDQDIPAETTRNDTNVILVQLRELLAEKELHVHSLKSESRELKDRLTTLESQVKSLESVGEERLRKVNSLNERLTEKTKINKSMAVVVEEYERTIAGLITDMEQDKRRNAEEKVRLTNERDEQTAHLASMEGSFSDLHSKYEKCKQIILSMKANEDAYKKSFQVFDEKLLKMQKNYDLLKQHATSKLNYANQELEKMNRTHDADVLKLNAMIKRKELRITSLEESLTQKEKAIEELTAICDELINKVG